LAVRSAATDELLGDLGVHFLADDGHQVEIGFTIAPAHQRQGFGTLAVVALLDYLFTVLNKHRVFASVDPRNEAPMALLRSVGMRQEAHFGKGNGWTTWCWGSCARNGRTRPRPYAGGRDDRFRPLRPCGLIMHPRWTAGPITVPSIRPHGSFHGGAEQ
jgi:RimJ/RimL family protein N-acetyltransferase